jgi:hypothetical protein
MHHQWFVCFKLLGLFERWLPFLFLFSVRVITTRGVGVPAIRRPQRAEAGLTGPQNGRTPSPFAAYCAFMPIRGLVASNFLAFLSDFVFLDLFVFLVAIFVPLFSSRCFNYNQSTTR